MGNGKMIHTESLIQKECVRWFRLAYAQLALNLFSVPNGGKRNRIEAAIMKGEGTVAGSADLILLYPSQGYHALCIEMKSPKGVQRQSQKEWQRAVEAQGYKYIIVRSFDEFRAEVSRYIRGRL